MAKIPKLVFLLVSVAAVLPAADPAVERGKYLVEEVGQCHTCHTPRLANGDYDKSKWLKGATLNIAPITPVEGWHKSAPDLTPGSRLRNNWKEEGLLNYLHTGLTPRGKPAGPPMPTYKLSTEDAKAVVAYLKSLGDK